jgi:hypothetical protein
MPLPAGYSWGCSTAVDDFGDKYHTDAWNGYYSLDFSRRVEDNYGHSEDTGNKLHGGIVDIFAAAGGTILDTPPPPNGRFPLRTTGCYQYGPTCQVNIDLGGGFVAKYLHFAADTIPESFAKGSQVRQGDYLGKMGNTGESGGTHLHFQLYYNEKSLSNVGELNGVTLEEKKFMDYTCADPPKEGRDYTLSTNGFSYTPTLGNPHLCITEPSGASEQNGWVNFCVKPTNFPPGQRLWGNLVITDVRRDFCQRGDWYRNGVKKETGSVWCSERLVERDYVWTRVHLWPSYTPTEAGDWELHYFVTTGATSLSDPNLNSHFLPAPLAVSKFTVTGTMPPASPTPTPSTLYTYDGNAYSCRGPVTNSGNPDWIFTCHDTATEFTPGQTAIVLARVNNITMTHRFKFDVYKDNVRQWGYEDQNQWNTVSGMWDHSYAWATVDNLTAGLWRVDFTIIFSNGTSEKFAGKEFRVTIPSGTAVYTYDGNLAICSGNITGGADTNWVYTCQNPTNTFAFGQVPKALVYIENIYTNHRFRGRAYKDNVKQWEYTSNWNDVGSGWSRAYFWLTAENAGAGNWRFEMEIGLPDNSFKLLKTVPFTITAPPDTNQRYDYNGNGVLCKGPVTGSLATNWVYTCQNPVGAILSGQTIYALVYLTNVKQSHYFRVEAFRNGNYQWDWKTTYNTVNPAQPWLYSHFWPSLSNATFGLWRFDIYVHTEDGNDTKIKSLDFIVF